MSLRRPQSYEISGTCTLADWSAAGVQSVKSQVKSGSVLEPLGLTPAARRQFEAALVRLASRQGIEDAEGGNER